MHNAHSHVFKTDSGRFVVIVGKHVTCLLIVV